MFRRLILTLFFKKFSGGQEHHTHSQNTGYFILPNLSGIVSPYQAPPQQNQDPRATRISKYNLECLFTVVCITGSTLRTFGYLLDIRRANSRCYHGREFDYTRLLAYITRNQTITIHFVKFKIDNVKTKTIHSSRRQRQRVNRQQFQQSEPTKKIRNSESTTLNVKLNQENFNRL